jgi:anti-sigma regulatory factor (Ser/Thr protein kinase)
MRTGRPDPHRDTSTSCEFALDADPSALRASRDRVGGWLAAARWPEDERDAIVYAVSEAVSNAAEHAYPPGSAGRVAVAGRIEDAARTGAGRMRRVRVSVRDEGRWRVAPLVDEGRRRGLLLMAALMDDVCVRSGCAPRAGTEVAMISTAIPA